MNSALWGAAGALASAYWAYKRRRPAEAELAGQSVLITGGSRGLGFALAEEFARQGCRVSICARDRDELRLAAERIAPAGKVQTYACDLRDPEQIDAMMQQVIAADGGLDILVNNAGLIQVGPAESMRPDDFREAMDLMFWAPFHTMAHAIPHFRNKHAGRIVNIASVGGLMSVPHLLPYCAAKFALVGLSSGLGVELKSANIHVTTVAPGLMRTGSHIQAEFRGQQSREYNWFGLAATLPVLTIPPRHAAEQIVTAVRQRRYHLTLPAWMSLVTKFSALAPEWVAAGMTMTNAILPDAPAGLTSRRPGKDFENDLIDRLGANAIAEFQNQPAGA